jgi:hypothetical protein
MREAGTGKILQTNSSSTWEGKPSSTELPPVQVHETYLVRQHKNILMKHHLTYCHAWLQTGYGLANEIIDHLYISLGTTSNYNTIADFDTTKHPTLSS